MNTYKEEYKRRSEHFWFLGKKDILTKGILLKRQHFVVSDDDCLQKVLHCMVPPVYNFHMYHFSIIGSGDGRVGKESLIR